MKDFFVEDAARFESGTVTSYFVLSSMQVREKKPLLLALSVTWTRNVAG
jgi:3'-5' exoribonuclease